jgi:hypothetical protein
MYLFSRRARLSGAKFRESIAWAINVTEKVAQTTGLQVGLWNQTFSPAVGTLAWSTFVPDLGALEAANDKLMVDDGARGMALGTEIAQQAEAVTGLPTLFLADATGNYGGVRWVTAFANVAELERAEMALNTNEAFVSLIDTKAKAVYRDEIGVTTQVILRRIPV